MLTRHSEVDFLLVEYEKLKDEQLKRIEVRDHLIYLTLVAVGTIFGYALEHPDRSAIFLILPFVCLVLGWTYIVNDQKVSAIGAYLREALVPRLKELDTTTNKNPSWETVHSSDARRRQRKAIQLLIDMTTFCASGAASVICYLVYAAESQALTTLLAIGELLLLSGLGVQIFIHSPLNAATPLASKVSDIQTHTTGNSTLD